MNQAQIATLLALALLISVGAAAPVARAFPPPPPDSSIVVDDPVVVRLYFRDRAHLDAVAGRLDIWETHPDAKDKYVVAAVTPDQYQWLESLGYRLEIDAERTARLGVTALLDPRFYYFDDYHPNTNNRYVVNFLQDTNAAYPDLTELADIGNAWMAAQPGEHARDIWVLRITNEDPAYADIADKPTFFLFTGIHAREVALPELAIRYIKYLTTGYDGEGGYGQDPDVTWLVNHNVVYVLLMQNPDGHWKNEQSTSNYRRKNMDWDDGCTNPGSWGVDLNRNHSFLWGCCGGSDPNPCGETYRGPTRGSEPETQAFENYFGAVMQDQNGPNGDDEIPPAAPITTTGIFISLHAYGDLVLWPWGFNNYGNPPNYAQMRTIGRKFAYYNGYDPSATIWYVVDGATDDWTYGKFGIPSYTFEVGPSGGSCYGFFPAYGCIDGIDGMPRNFWAENKPTFLYAHKIARTPYVTAYGPDAQNLSTVPSEVVQGTPVQLMATIADHRYGNDTLQPIVAAEYFIDAPPATGEDGTGFPMAPIDGDWGGLSEQVVATVDTSGLTVGQHYILVHGQNANGGWGPLTAVFLEVAPTPDSVVAGVVRNGDTGALIEQAQVGLLGGPFDQFTTTGLDGTFHFDTYSGTYTLTAVALGYHPVTVTDVIATTGMTITRSISLTGFLMGTQLQLGKTAIPDQVFPGDLLTYTLTLTNNSTVSATHIVITDVLPAYTAFAWASDGGVLTDGVVAWDVPVVFTQETLSLTLVVTVTGAPTGTPLVNGTYGARSDQLPTPIWGQPVTVTVFCDAPLTGADFTWLPAVPYAGVPVTFTAVVTGGTLALPDGTLVLPVTYAWDWGDDNPLVTRNPVTHTYSLVGTYTATLSVTNVCHVAPLEVSHPVSITVFSFPHHVYLPALLRGVGG
ncbi:MAG: M14 family zinc carboxypeptidase [Anaerolineae bacterium]